MAAIAQPLTQEAASKTEAKASRKGRYKSWAPTAKVSAGMLAGAATILITSILTPHWKEWTQQDMTPAVVAAITNILTFAVQYWVPERTG